MANDQPHDIEMHRTNDEPAGVVPAPQDKAMEWEGGYEEGKEKFIGNLGLTFTGPEGNSMGVELMTWTLWRGVLGEFIATFFFLYITIGTVISTNQNDTPATLTGLGNARHLMIAFSFGIAIMVLVYGFATVSGGHINPAVSFMLCITKKITPVRCILYIVAQHAGGLAGVAAVESWNEDLFEQAGGGCNTLSVNFTNGSAWCAEIFSTMILLLAVQAAVDHKQDNNVDYAGQGATHISGLAPLAIGFSVFLAHLINIPITGCSINPARTWATAMLGPDCWDQHAIFWLAPMVASIIAAVLYEVVIKDKKVYHHKDQ